MNLMTNPFDFFDKIFYINLDSRTDRNKLMEEQFIKFNINAERFSAVNLTKEQNDDLVKRGCNFYDGPRPEYAPRIKSCTISHLNILLRAKMMGYRNVLILEDDALFDDNILEELGKCVDELKNKEWDMFYLGCNPLEYYKETENLGRVLSATTTHAYAINKRMYEHILNNAEFFKYYPCIDGYYSNLGKNQDNKIYLSLKNLIIQREDFSDIEGRSVDYTFLINDKYKYSLIDKPEGW
jgi:GR25 family glycosyltransferase involved in LPS biosynthesis